MKNLSRVMTETKLPKEILEEIKLNIFLMNITDDIFRDYEGYLINSRGIIISEGKTKLLDREKWTREYHKKNNIYDLNGMLLSSEIFVTSDNKIKEHRVINYDSQGKISEKITNPSYTLFL